MYNGTFFNSEVLRVSATMRRGELASDSDRRRFELPDRERMASIEDLKARGNNYISRDSDWISLESIVSTSPDQSPSFPDICKKSGPRMGDAISTTKTDGRILNFFSVLSARYEVKRDTWRGRVSFGKLGESDGLAMLRKT